MSGAGVGGDSMVATNTDSGFLDDQLIAAEATATFCKKDRLFM
jgi:hypothetical protein